MITERYLPGVGHGDGRCFGAISLSLLHRAWRFLFKLQRRVGGLGMGTFMRSPVAGFLVAMGDSDCGCGGGFGGPGGPPLGGGGP